MSQTEWIDLFPALQTLDPQTLRDLATGSISVSVPAGTVVFRELDTCNNFLLVLEGSVRVQKLSESGREIVLYRVESGQSCVLTTSCLLAGERYSAEGIAETDVRAVALPDAIFSKAVASCRPFREFVFASYGDRIAGLLMLIDAVAFGRMDGRLASLLYEKSRDSDEVEMMHQELARELGTAREVVSRLLKEFERRGWLLLGRGRVRILDHASLLKLSEKVFG
jgi:CRP/FNR family transcriptional regulator